MSLFKMPYLSVACKHCGSHNVIKFGHYHGIQRLYCKDCKRKFADNEALPNMQTPIDQVGAAIGMFYEGQSLSSITRLLTQIYNSYPSDSTVYRWIARFTRRAVARAKDYIPKAGNRWIADETMLDIGGRKVWFWDIIDEDTRFLLASHISRSRTTNDARRLIRSAFERTGGKIPSVIITDGLRSYQDAVELEFGSDTKHIRSRPFTEKDTTNRIERFHGSLKDRTKVMRGLKEVRTARLILDGWLLHYNFIRKHETLV